MEAIRYLERLIKEARESGFPVHIAQLHHLLNLMKKEG